MCLEVVRQTEGLPKWGVGYKVFNRDIGGLIFTGKPFHIGETRDDDIDMVIKSTRNKKDYKCGYHIYKYRAGARLMSCTLRCCRERIFKIRFSRITTIGTQGECAVIVARRISILEEVK